MLKRLGQVAVILFFIVLLMPVFKVLTYSQQDDKKHLAEKQAYLEAIASQSGKAEKLRPNIVIILLDDMGYRDLGTYGGQSINTPNIDSLAEKGVKFTQYYSPSPSCTPSRAGLLTGRYAPRAGLPTVVHPTGSGTNLIMKLQGFNLRLPAEEILIPEVLRAAGYSTGMIGKWHLGDRTPALPTERGFDQFFGAHYSNDMEPFALYRDEEIAIPAPVDQTRLNEHYVSQAIAFIESADSNKPFFLYFSHNFPHVPLHSSAEQAGKSDGGLYGDVMEDVDAGIGDIIATLKKIGVLDNTLIVVTSDNGPWFQGSSGPARGRKFQTWDGGMRVPFIAHWPEHIPSGKTVSIPVSGVDIFPTILSLLNLPLPTDRIIDGHDITANLKGEQEETSQRYIYYFDAVTLDAVRDQRFKFHRQRGVRSIDVGDMGSIKMKKGPWLFDYRVDQQESYDVSSRHPEDRKHMQAVFEQKQAEMSENPRGWLD